MFTSVKLQEVELSNEHFYLEKRASPVNRRSIYLLILLLGKTRQVAWARVFLGLFNRSIRTRFCLLGAVYQPDRRFVQVPAAD